MDTADADIHALSVAAAALREAAQLCQSVQRRLDYGVIQKGDRSPVTVADYGSQALICRALHAAFPDDAIVAEEDAAALRSATGSTVAHEVVRHVQRVRPGANLADVVRWIDYGSGEPARGRYWTLDPIDGTKGFLRGQQYAIALALMEDGRIRAGALACPNLDGGLLFTAASGHGAHCLDLQGSAPPRAIRVSSTREIADARLCESVESAHSAHRESSRLATLLKIKAKSVRLDSQAKYAAVARGQADIYLRLPTSRTYQEKIWDHAAGALILVSAGGRVTDVYGRELDFSRGKTLARNKGVIATNGHLHTPVIEALAELRARYLGR